MINFSVTPYGAIAHTPPGAIAPTTTTAFVALQHAYDTQACRLPQEGVKYRCATILGSLYEGAVAPTGVTEGVKLKFTARKKTAVNTHGQLNHFLHYFCIIRKQFLIM